MAGEGAGWATRKMVLDIWPIYDIINRKLDIMQKTARELCDEFIWEVKEK